MIEYWWAIWAAWAWWRYRALREDMPILSRDESKELLRGLVASGIRNKSELEAYGVRHCDIEEWERETYKAMSDKLEHDIEIRQCQYINKHI